MSTQKKRETEPQQRGINCGRQELGKSGEIGGEGRVGWKVEDTVSVWLPMSKSEREEGGKEGKRKSSTKE